MYCPRCGNLIIPEDSRFCSRCGCVLDGYSEPPGRVSNTDRPITNDEDRHDTGNIILATIVVAILIACLTVGIVSFNTYTDDGIYSEHDGVIFDRDYHSTNSLSDGSITIEEGTNKFNGDKISECIVFKMNPEIAEKYGYYSWHLFDKDHSEYTATKGIYGVTLSKYNGIDVDKKDPVLYWNNCDPCSVTLKVYCYEKEGDTEYREYSGGLVIYGTEDLEYKWDYDSRTYTITTKLDYSDYMKYRDLDINPRGSASYNSIAKFVTDDSGTISDISEQLKEQYLIGYGKNADVEGQGFADFILGYVQMCFDYPPYNSYLNADEYLYGSEEYYAYPLQTIYHGMGDCEDTSILAAAIYHESGYDTGICMLPNHATVGVYLKSYVDPVYNHYGYEILTEVIHGRTYYIGETTVGSTLPLGIMTAKPDGGWYSDYIYKDYYGLRLVED